MAGFGEERSFRKLSTATSILARAYAREKNSCKTCGIRQICIGIASKSKRG